MGGARECRAGRVRVSAFPVQRDVAGGGRPQLGRTRVQRCAAVDHHVELLVVHDDPLGGIRRGSAVSRDDHRHGVADVHHPVAGEQRVRDVDGLLAVAADYAVRLAERSDAVRLQLAVRECRDDPWRCSRIRGVDGDDARMRVRRANDPGMGLVCAIDVVDESTAPGEQGGVFAPRDARADGGDECAGQFLVLLGFVAEH